MIVTLLLTASMAGCAAQAAEGETTKAEGSNANALQIGGGGSTDMCPGGGAPACVKCSGIQCVYACAGANTCQTDANSCAWAPKVCRTLSFSPGFGKVMY
jgi:hypothetical protein